MMNGRITSTILTCPTCGGMTFSWLVEARQSGTIHHIDESYHEYGDTLEQTTSCDDDHDIVCTTCYEEHDRDDFIPTDEAQP